MIQHQVTIVLVDLPFILEVVELFMVEVVVISKADLRLYAKNLRLKIKNKALKDAIILQKILNHPKIIESENILVYVSLEHEVDTKKLILELLKRKKKVYAPKIIDNDLIFYKVNNIDELKKGKFNIFEPTSKELYASSLSSCIIVPGLLFDKSFNRLGYGGGYYDRFLNAKKIYKIGVCYQELQIESLEVLDYDIKMDEVITSEVKNGI